MTLGTVLSVLLVLFLAGCGREISGTTTPNLPTPGSDPTSPRPSETPLFHWNITAAGTETSATTRGGAADTLPYAHAFWDTTPHHGAGTDLHVTLSVTVDGRLVKPDKAISVDMNSIPHGWAGRPDGIDDGRCHPALPFVSEERAVVRIGGYGSVSFSAFYGGQKSTLALVFPGNNATFQIDLIYSDYGYALVDTPVISSQPMCTDQRSAALSYTNRLWRRWPLPIPVDVVDGFPFDESIILEQVANFADQIEDQTGIRIITEGNIISRVDADASRPRRERRFHLGYQIADCTSSVTACAHLTEGFATWTRSNPSAATRRALRAVPHEIEHLLGFKHPESWNEENTPGHGVFMVSPQRRPPLAGQTCWGKWWGLRDYVDYNWTTYASSETLRNLQCIFRDHEDDIGKFTSWRINLDFDIDDNPWSDRVFFEPGIIENSRLIVRCGYPGYADHLQVGARRDDEFPESVLRLRFNHARRIDATVSSEPHGNDFGGDYDFYEIRGYGEFEFEAYYLDGGSTTLILSLERGAHECYGTTVRDAARSGPLVVP